MEIRRATYEDKAAIFEFLEIAYAGRAEFKYPQRWEWAYEHNPYLPSDGPPIWIAVSPDGRVVGQSAALVEPLIVEQQEYRVGWGVDFFVLPEFRGKGIGSRLQAANNEAQQVFMSLSMAKGAAQIKSRMGMLSLPAVPLFTRILHHDVASVRQTLETRLPWLPPVKALAPLAARILTRRSIPPPRSMPGGIEIRMEEAFTQAHDRLFHSLSDAYAVLIRRDSRYLTWKFRQQPHMQHEIFGAYWNGRLSGCMILRRGRPPERNVGILVDLFAHPDDRELINALLDHAIHYFFEQKVTYMTAASSVPQICERLLEKQFKQTQSITPMARAPFRFPLEGWLLAKGDHDWDQYPLA